MLPAQVPYLPVDTDLLTTETKHDGVVVGGYPATALLAGGSGAALTREIATSTIAELFTFGSSYADIFYLTGSRVGEHGVSGGPVINDHGRRCHWYGDTRVTMGHSVRAAYLPSLSYVTAPLPKKLDFR
ncbi:MAG: hypothetical protein R3B69_03995 [Candidatus Paceibacterota bacterium]